MGSVRIFCPGLLRCDLVYKRGVGPRPIHQKRLSAEGLAEAITRTVTDQEMRDCAATLGEKIRGEDGVGNAVRLIQQHVS
jgi:sterol 3beta-glucosyltransferase